MTNSHKSVLIVEDEKPLAGALKLKLEHEGFLVTLAVTGQECVDLCSTRHFDVILLDLIMPAMDGFQVLEWLQEQPNPPTVFVISNLSQPEDEERVRKLGAQKFFVKSDTPLTKIVDEVQKV
ncbi:MAG TPA: response regulator [Candidatus Saccharimonadales bacterium]|nr:response regulator [Candidatus Saccharimonadales bacterium]